MPQKPLKWRKTESGCFEPTSHTADDGHGYPQFTRNGKKVRIYRHRFEKKNGPVPTGLLVRHTCDNRKCINTDHMLLGTRAENMHDKTARGRTVKGETNGRSKLMEHDARYILRSSLSHKKLAEKFKVSYDAILSIRSGKRWKHLQPKTVMRLAN
jgi:hypothetical protein